MISSILSTFSKGSRPDLRFFGQESFLPQFQAMESDYAIELPPQAVTELSNGLIFRLADGIAAESCPDVF